MRHSRTYTFTILHTNISRRFVQLRQIIKQFIPLSKIRRFSSTATFNPRHACPVFRRASDLFAISSEPNRVNDYEASNFGTWRFRNRISSRCHETTSEIRGKDKRKLELFSLRCTGALVRGNPSEKMQPDSLEMLDGCDSSEQFEQFGSHRGGGLDFLVARGN